MKQYTRQLFRDAVFERDNHTCIVPGCGLPAQDAHHILERALWKEPEEQGGYLPVNGASLCDLHHRDAEKDFIPPHALRTWASVPTMDRTIPAQLDPDLIYTKWGVPVKTPSMNSWGRVKYPHTPYLYISPSADEKDVSEAGFSTTDCLLNKPLIVLTKMDGGNTLIDENGTGARNTIASDHPSFDKLKSRQLSINIIPGFQLHGENLYAKHSIHYRCELALTDDFMLFAVYYKPFHMWLGWSAVEVWANVLKVPTVPVVERLRENNKAILHDRLNKIGKRLVSQGHEGFVVRSEYPFYYGHFKDNLAKYVRKQHVQTETHWSNQPMVKNEIKVKGNE